MDPDVVLTFSGLTGLLGWCRMLQPSAPCIFQI